MGGVDDVEERNQFVGWERGADFDANRVFNAPNVFDVGTCELPCAVTNPKEVRRGIVKAFSGFERGWGEGRGGLRVGEVSGEGLFVLKQQGFVTRVEVDCFQTTRGAVGSDSSHEAEAFRNALHNALVLCFDVVVTNMAQAPVKRRMQISQTG